MAAEKKEYRKVDGKTRAGWRRWLMKNHATPDSVWLIIWKKQKDKKYMTIAEAVEEALCFGWIDSVGNKVDGERFKLRFSPRNPKSKWSKINKARVKKLTKEGLMTEAGLVVIKQAKKSGTWNALDKVEEREIPSALKKAFRDNRTAEKNFKAFSGSVQKMILNWITDARTEETRARRIKETVDKAALNERANQWKPKKI